MTLKIYNTLGRKQQEFKPIKGKEIRMYTCGPTVYNFAHIGNYRAYIFEDQLRRYLEYKGYKVIQVMNLTDIDDKTIRDSQKEGIPLNKFTDRYKKAFFEDLKTLNIEKAEHYPAATDYIEEMVSIIKKLLDKGYAYVGEDKTIYYSIKKFKDYGKLSGIKVKQLKAGARVSQDEYEKESASDFALWKAWDENDGDVFWETELGKGRPGWHIECSAMSTKLLGNHFDIHTGGVDNMFPHHENEIAQSEAVTGETFANYWLHCAHLLVNNKKMSKSLGNFYTLRDIIKKGHDPKAIRYVLLSTHYRQQLNFTFEGLDAAKNSVNRLLEFMRNLKSKTGKNDNPRLENLTKNVEKEFEKAMDNDLNISDALASIFNFVRDINKIEVSKKDAKKVIKTMQKFDLVLGLLDEEEQTINKEIESLILQREKARKEKDWAKADKIRDQLKEEGIILEDTKEGIKWKKTQRSS